MDTSADKAFADLRARFALAGHELHRTDGENGHVRYIASRWGHCRSLMTLDEARAFLAQIGGAQ
nr:hypothetical protein [Variovorax boronicumulans]